MSSDAEFERIVDLYYPSLYRFAFSLTRQESDACDLTQQTFYIWATKRHQLREEAKVKSWLFTTLHREFLRKTRRSIRFPETEIGEAEGELPQITPAGVAMLDGKTIVAALGRVDLVFQAPVSLFYLEDYSYPEIANILEIPLGTVKSRISRGVAQLQRLILETNPTGKELRA